VKSRWRSILLPLAALLLASCLAKADPIPPNGSGHALVITGTLGSTRLGERAYTVAEIDDLRAVCEFRYIWGTTFLIEPMGTSREYNEQDMNKYVEDELRTYMLAGITAQDIRDEDKRKAKQRAALLNGT
jgi:hypothetical protein